MHPLFQKREVRIAAGSLLGVVLLLLTLIVVLTWGKELDERHRPLDFSETFDLATGTFADYTAYAERRVRAARTDVTDEVIVNLTPFRLVPPQNCPASSTATYRNGIVLTHDLRETPYAMRELGTYFQERCFLVYGLLLPGHGTRPGDLLRTGWEDWAAAERMAVRDLGAEVDNLYLGGHGAGGTLALLEASGNAGVDGLVLFAPTLDTRRSPWQSFAGAAFGWLASGTRWADVVPAYSAYRYESRPYRLQAEANALVGAALEALPERPFEVPVFAVVSLEDSSANAAAMLAYMAERVHPLSQTIVYSRHPVDVQPGQTLVGSNYPELGLMSFSHQGLMIPQHDPAFGWYGASRDCGHYYRADREAYGLCMAGERTLVGEITPENLAEEGVLERSQFNLFFYEMLRELDRFITPVVETLPDVQPR